MISEDAICTSSKEKRGSADIFLYLKPLIQDYVYIPSKQSTMGERYTFPAGIAISVMSVSHFLFGLDAEKFLFIIFSTSGETSPA